MSDPSPPSSSREREPSAHSSRQWASGRGSRSTPTLGRHSLATMSWELAVTRVREISRLCDAVKLSDEDAEWLYPGLPIDRVVSSLLECGARVVVVTKGQHGAVLGSGAVRVDVDAVPVAVIDTVGAGDTFMAALIDGMLRLPGAHLGGVHALRWLGRRAAAAAAVTVQRTGADLPTWDDDVALGLVSQVAAGGYQAPRLTTPRGGASQPL